jgi:serine/threonine protein kinase
LLHKLLKSATGVVYRGVNVVSKEDVAIKLEPIEAECLQLQHEYRVFKHLTGGIGIPIVRWFGTEGDYNAMVLQYLGLSLEDIFDCCNRKFSLKTILLLADQMVCTGHHTHYHQLS